MKTSNKILSATVIFTIIGIFFYFYELHGAYKKALANPQSMFINLGLKESKYLNINHHWNVNFKQGPKFQVQLHREYKDSLHCKYVGDSLNLDAINAGEITIITPNLPIMKFNSDKGSELQVYIEKSILNKNIEATFLKTCSFIIGGGKFENVSIKSNESLKLQIEDCEIKKLSLNLPKHSEIALNYSSILTKNFVLADSCSVNITGNYSGEYYGKIIK
jgi:hypothetical protein